MGFTPSGLCLLKFWAISPKRDEPATNRKIRPINGARGPISGLLISIARCRFSASHAYLGCGLDVQVADPIQAVMGGSFDGSCSIGSLSLHSEALLAGRMLECTLSMRC